MQTSVTSCKLFLTILLAVVFAPIPALGQRLHPRFKEAKNAKPAINRILILPISISLVKDGMKGGEPLEKEAAAAMPIIEKALAQVLTEKKLSVLDSPFKPEALANDEKLKYAVADVQRNYNELLAKMSRKQKDVEKGRFSLGDQVLLLNQDDNIDAFVFVRAFGQKKSGGKKALGILTLSPFMLLSTYVVNIGIADARTGDILAYTQAVSLFDIAKEDGRNLAEMLKRSLKKLPAGEAGDGVVEKKQDN